MNKVVLINPLNPLVRLSEKMDYEYGKLPLPFLGILYIASSLKKARYDVEVADAQYYYAKDIDFVEYMYENYSDVKIFAMNCCISTFEEVKSISKLLKTKFPNCIIIVGGPHATLYSESVISDENIDFVSIGEGEKTLTEFCDYFFKGKGTLEEIKGLVWVNEDGKLIYTEKREFNNNLDELPFPAKDIVDKNSYRDFGTIITGRGCPGRCIYCAASPLSGSRYRWRSPENVIKEVEECISNYDIEHIFFIDDTFTVKKDRVLEICKYMKTIYEKYRISWSCESRATTVSKELLEVMAKSGCKFIQFGMESGSNDVLNQIGKGVSIKQIENAARWAVGYGMRVAGSFIIGHHCDTEETVQQTIEFAKKIRNLDPKNVKIVFSINTPLPGTELYERADELGIKFLSDDFTDYNFFTVVAETKNLTAEQIQNYYYDGVLMSRGVDI